MSEILEYTDKSVCKRRLSAPCDRRATDTLGLEIEVFPYKGLTHRQFADALYERDRVGVFERRDFVLKTDASLAGLGYEAEDGGYENLEGLEMVTGVMSQSWSQRFDWESWFAGLSPVLFVGRAESRAASDLAGMHVHAGKSWTSPDHADAVGFIAGYLLSTASVCDILRLFGRFSGAYAGQDSSGFTWGVTWTGFMRGRTLSELSKRQLRSHKVSAKHQSMSSRFRLVNRTCPDTVEFRGFATPSNGAQVRYALSLVTSIMDFATAWLKKPRRKPNFDTFVRQCPLYETARFWDAS